MKNANQKYAKAVCKAAAELYELAVPVQTWEKHAQRIITKHLTPLFRRLRDEAKRKK